METSVPPPFPPMPREYYHRQAERVRKLAQEATTPDIRQHLADVALQYEHLAEEAEAGHRALR
jgi:formate dehydrogenase maturation protein FdhE